jgi:glycine/D-amino acid oxidase-like deaminating enzyme
MDVVFVGGGPAGLSSAIELARLARNDAESGVALGRLSQGRARQERGKRDAATRASEFRLRDAVGVLSIVSAMSHPLQ